MGLAHKKTIGEPMLTKAITHLKGALQDVLVMLVVVLVGVAVTLLVGM